VRDQRQATQTEEIRAAVGVGIEAVAEAPRGRADEQAAELPRRGGGDLSAKRVEEGADRALEGLENDVAGATVGDDDGVGAAEDVATLRVAAEVQVACGEEVVRLERQLVALLAFLADREEAHLRLCELEDPLCEVGPQRRDRVAPRLERARDDLGGAPVTAHRIDRDADHVGPYGASRRSGSTSRPL